MTNKKDRIELLKGMTPKEQCDLLMKEGLSELSDDEVQKATIELLKLYRDYPNRMDENDLPCNGDAQECNGCSQTRKAVSVWANHEQTVVASLCAECTERMEGVDAWKKDGVLDKRILKRP